MTGSLEGRAAMADAPLRNVDITEKAISAAGAAVISAVIVNPLDVAKVCLKPSVYLIIVGTCIQAYSNLYSNKNFFWKKSEFFPDMYPHFLSLSMYSNSCT